MNKRLALAVRNPTCSMCSLGQQNLDPKERCVTGFGPNNAQWMIVTNYPVDPGSHLHRQMIEQLAQVGLDGNSAAWCSVIKCKVWEVQPNVKELKTCKPYLEGEIEFFRPKYILTYGNEAMYPFVGRKSGINKYKGRITEYNGVQVFHTTSPVLAMKKPSQLPALLADLRYFSNLMKGKSSPDFHKPDPNKVHTVKTAADLKIFRYHLKTSTTMAFDIESTDLDEYMPHAKVVSLAATLATDGMRDAEVWRLPLYHPESPFRRNWKSVLKFLAPALKSPGSRSAHNGKHDCRWLRRFGVPGMDYTFDTILALAVLDENRSKGLKPAAQEILGAEPWGIDTKNLLETPLDDVLEYNGLDTWHTLRLYYHLKQQLRQNPRQGNLFARLLMPAMLEYINMESVGIYVDREKLEKHAKIIRNNLAGIEYKLEDFLPSGGFPEEFIAKRSREVKINWNPSNFCRWFLFEHLKLPVVRTGKTGPSMAKADLLTLQDKHEVVPLMLERSKWNQLENTFITAYEELLDSNSRLRTVFKPWGPVTGRTSSGKQDEEKTTGAVQGKGVNLQNVPRERLVRSVIGAQPSWLFVNADYSQIELRGGAFLAQEPTMLNLFNTGQDIHLAAAMQMTGKPASQITKDERQRAKARNFGFLYGMGWRKFIAQAFIDYGIAFSEEEAKANRDSFFEQFPALRYWHARQKRIAAKYGRVQTPMGRVRHLPDIYSPDENVRAEAERQAINSPVQAMASDLAQLSMVHINRKFRKRKLQGRSVGFVHDSVMFEIHQDHVLEALPIIKDTMENLPLEKLFGFSLNVPLVADIQIGQYWTEGVELTSDEIYNGTALERLSAVQN